MLWSWQVGDQILEVNGRSFLSILHDEAVRLLKSSQHLILTVKDVGRLPHARTTVDETKWIASSRIGDPATTSSAGSGPTAHAGPQGPRPILLYSLPPLHHVLVYRERTSSQLVPLSFLCVTLGVALLLSWPISQGKLGRTMQLSCSSLASGQSLSLLWGP